MPLIIKVVVADYCGIFESKKYDTVIAENLCIQVAGQRDDLILDVITTIKTKKHSEIYAIDMRPRETLSN